MPVDLAAVTLENIDTGVLTTEIVIPHHVRRLEQLARCRIDIGKPGFPIEITVGIVGVGLSTTHGVETRWVDLLARAKLLRQHLSRTGEHGVGSELNIIGRAVTETMALADPLATVIQLTALVNRIVTEGFVAKHIALVTLDHESYLVESSCVVS